MAIHQQLGNARGEAEALTQVGAVHRQLGDMNRARDAYTRAIELRRTVGDEAGESSTLHNLGTLHWTMGDYSRALESYTQSLHIRQRRGDRRAESETLIGLAMTHRMLARSTAALELYQRALVLKRDVGDRFGEALALHNTGVLYSTLGDLARALEYYMQALSIRQELGDQQAVASTMTSIAVAHRLLGDPKKAIEYHEQALPLLETGQSRRELAETLTNLGKSYQQSGDLRAAIRAYERALPLARQAGDRRNEAFALGSLASGLVAAGDIERARMHIAESRQLAQQIGDADGEANALLTMAEAAAASGQLDEALQHVDSGLSVIESLRAQVTVPALRATFPGLKQNHYTLKIDLLMRLHQQNPNTDHAERAFLTNERRRSRALLETIDRAQLSVARDDDFSIRATRLRADITRAATARLAASASDAARLELELTKLLGDYEVLQGRMRESSPATVGLSTTLERVSDLQRLLEDDTAVVEYSLAPKRSYAWVVTKDRFQNIALSDGTLIEAAARDYFEMVTVRPQRASRVRRQQAAETLSRLLITPIAAALSHRRLVIVSDGALHYVPFAALPEPNPSAGNGQPVALLKQHEIVQLPSAAVLQALRARDAARPRAPKQLAMFADPVFRADDPRLGVTTLPARSAPVVRSLSEPEMGDTIRKAMTDTELPRLDRLTGSAKEAAAILALAPSADSLSATGLKAQRSLVLSPALSDYRVIHFATHGLLNSRRPELSGMVLSLVDSEGRPQDGFVALADVLNLQLNADLVVLSACRTALGRDIRGEGIVGLTRGFMSAGASRIVASLWDVQDASTATLMAHFYRGVFQRKQSPAAALRSAQLEMLRDPRWSEPYYWAAFTLQGDWRAF